MKNFFKIWMPAVTIALSVAVLPSCQKESLLASEVTSELGSVDRGGNPKGRGHHQFDTTRHHQDSTHIGGGHPCDSSRVHHDSTHVGGGHQDSTHMGGGIHPQDSTHIDTTHGGGNGGHGGHGGHGGNGGGNGGHGGGH
jgi:hypothetical protein